MKNLICNVFLLVFLAGSLQTFAQFRNNGNPGGVDRSIGAANRYNKPKKQEPIDYAKAMSENLTEKLELDGFQSAIVKNLIDDYVKKANEIGLMDIPNDAKTEKSNNERLTMEAKLTEILNEKQKLLFEDLKNKKSDKKKKGKKKKESSEEDE